MELRELILGNYRLIYRIELETVFVVTIAHSARDLATLWERRNGPTAAPDLSSRHPRPTPARCSVPSTVSTELLHPVGLASDHLVSAVRSAVVWFARKTR